MPTCGPLLLSPPALKRRGPPRRQGLCSHLAHVWATSDSAPLFEVVRTPPGGRGYVATLPTCRRLLILPAALKRRGPPRRQALCSHVAQLWARSHFAPALKRWGPPRRQGLCSHLAQLWAGFDFVPRFEAVGTPLGGRGYVATLATCRRLLILPAALKRRGSPRRQGFCSHVAQLWASSHFAPALKRWGPPRWQGLCSHLAQLWAGFDFVPRFEAVGTPLGGWGYAATLPTCGPPLILPPSLKQWGPPRRQGLCSHLAHFSATSHFDRRFEVAAIPKAAEVM